MISKHATGFDDHISKMFTVLKVQDCVTQDWTKTVFLDIATYLIFAPISVSPSDAIKKDIGEVKAYATKKTSKRVYLG